MAAKKPKRPKKPKASASLATWENYDKRVKDWETRCRQIETDKKKKISLIRKHS